MFDDRADAARQLAGRLAHLRGRQPLIVAVPRGAVPMGVILAQALGGDLDLVMVRKLGAPGNPEYAIGAVDEAGHLSLNPDTEAHVDAAYLAAEAARQGQVLARRRAQYAAARVDPAGRIVVVVDDGVATGATLLAALDVLRQSRPARLIAAVGVAPPASRRAFAGPCRRGRLPAGGERFSCGRTVLCRLRTGWGRSGHGAAGRLAGQQTALKSAA